MPELILSAPGLVCCAGNNRKDFFNAALHGDQSGIKPHNVGSRTFLAGLFPETGIDSKNKLYSFTLMALEQIRAEAEAVINEYGADRVGVCAGSCDNGSEASLAAHRLYFSGGEPSLAKARSAGGSGGSFPDSYKLAFQSAQIVSELIAEVFGIKGPCVSIATACASGASAIVKGAELIESGLCDAVISGGADLASRTALTGFAALEAVSDKICNPFSKNRNGITLGEGAAFFVIRKDTKKEGSPKPDILLLGWGESSDGYHLTAPRPDGSGACTAMKEALNMAGLKPEDIDYINLHGTGTPLNDSMEALAVNSVFKDSKPYVSSTKPVTGHTLGAAGALEISLCWMSLAEGGLPVHCWDKECDTEMPELNFVQKGVKAKNKICMSNSFAFGGCNVSLIVGRSE